MPQRFIDRLQPAPLDGGFRMPDHWVWGGSPIRGDDGRYHLFASRWPKAMPFSPHWLTNSEVVRAAADTPAGPYHFEEVVLPVRGREHWDGLMTHNPSIQKSGDTYLLFYTGTTYEGDVPTPESPLPRGGHRDSPQAWQARSNQRIGLATAPSVLGPWRRRDEPILQPRPDNWDAVITTNPAPCVLDDSSGVLLVYKSIPEDKGPLLFGVARAERFEGPYERLSDEPILCEGREGMSVEDGYVWRNREGVFEILLKDIPGNIGGEVQGGVHATSRNGVEWSFSDPPQAYSRTVRWSDGSTTTQGHLERVQLLIEGGEPTHLFAATGNGTRQGYTHQPDTWCMCIPLNPSG